MVRALLRKCGITEEITSPTFVCVNSYKNKKGITFNHFDLYRIKLLDEFVESGFDEYLYHIDRMMMNLKRAGKLNNLAGLIVGGMSEMNDNKIPFGKTANKIIAETIEEYNYPVCFDFPAGHKNDNRVLILGREIKFNVEKKVEVKF